MASYPDPWVDDGKVWAYYNVTTTESATSLLYETSGFSGMEIDGTALSVATSHTFSETGEHLVKFTLSDPTSIGGNNGAFRSRNSLKRLYLPDTVKTVKRLFCYQNSGVTFIRFSPNTETLGDQVCYQATNLSIEISLPKLKTIGNGALNTTKITKILNLGEITTLPNSAIRSTATLTDLVLPSTLTTLSDASIYDVSGLKRVVCYAAVPPYKNSNVFWRASLVSIKVPPASVDAYKTATNWSSYASKIYPLWEEAPIAINHLSLGDFRRRIMIGISLPSPLPDGAIPCESIYSDGIDTFIPTTFVPLATMSFEGDMTYVIPTSSFIAPFGYNISSRRYSPVVFENQRLQVGYNGWYWGDATLFPKIVKLKVKAIATPTQTIVKHYLPDGTLYNSQTITYNEASFVPSETIALMGRRAGASSILSGSWRGGLGRLKMYGDDHFGNLVADFIPCYYQNNFGMWDKVGQQHLIGNTPGSIGGFGYHWDTEGFWPNTLNDLYHSAKPYLTDDRSYITTRDFAVPAGCTQVQMRVSSSTLNDNIPILMCLDSSKTYVTWYSYNAVDRVVTLTSNTAFVRLSIPRSYFGDAWLKDYTHGTYIWKGINVT